MESFRVPRTIPSDVPPQVELSGNNKSTSIGNTTKTNRTLSPQTTAPSTSSSSPVASLEKAPQKKKNKTTSIVSSARNDSKQLQQQILSLTQQVNTLKAKVSELEKDLSLETSKRHRVQKTIKTVQKQVASIDRNVEDMDVQVTSMDKDVYCIKEQLPLISIDLDRTSYNFADIRGIVDFRVEQAGTLFDQHEQRIVELEKKISFLNGNASFGTAYDSSTRWSTPIVSDKIQEIPETGENEFTISTFPNHRETDDISEENAGNHGFTSNVAIHDNLQFTDKVGFTDTRISISKPQETTPSEHSTEWESASSSRQPTLERDVQSVKPTPSVTPTSSVKPTPSVQTTSSIGETLSENRSLSGTSEFSDNPPSFAEPTLSENMNLSVEPNLSMLSEHELETPVSSRSFSVRRSNRKKATIVKRGSTEKPCRGEDSNNVVKSEQKISEANENNNNNHARKKRKAEPDSDQAMTDKLTREATAEISQRLIDMCGYRRTEFNKTKEILELLAFPLRNRGLAWTLKDVQDWIVLHFPRQCSFETNKKKVQRMIVDMGKQQQQPATD